MSSHETDGQRLQRRHRDRDNYRRRDRSADRRYDNRRDDDHSYSTRRDKSRDRRHSRERGERRRSRDRDRLKRDDSRNGDRRKREDSADSRRKRRREDSKDRSSRKESENVSQAVRGRSRPIPTGANNGWQISKPTTPTAASADDQKAARLAKLEAWKKKRAEEQAQKQKQLVSVGGARSLLSEIDRREGLSPATASPQSPASPEVQSPAPYAGKFDPKAIVKKAHATSAQPNVLGADVAAPLSVNGTTPKPPKVSGPENLIPRSSAGISKPPVLKPRGNVSGFGLSNKSTVDSDAPKSNLDFGEDEETRKKLERLPQIPNGVNGPAPADQDQNDAMQDDGDDEPDNEAVADDADEEEQMAAARAAAEKRSQAERGEDAVMEDAPPVAADNPMDEEEEEEVEEVDPLDAFMSGLSTAPVRPRKTFSKGNTRQMEPEAMFSDDEVDQTAVDSDNPDNILSTAAAITKKKKKDIPTINHGKIIYESFRKNFYSEPVDMADWSEEDVANLRMQLENIKVRGVDVPKPVQSWAQCGLGVQSSDVIKSLGYEAPTSIQAQAIPAIMSGRDVIGVAKTGSGKTIAFLLPMFRHIKDQRPLDSLDGPVGLILSPTRELATQIHRECKPFLKALNLRAVCAYGGAPIKDQIADLKRGAEIIVCTPGRMIDLLAANSGRVTNLRRVTYVVLDEADRMFDMGFEPQVMKILNNIRPERQTVLFSATFPRQMEALARKALAKPVEIVVGGRSVVAPEITQVVEVRSEDQKFHRLLELLGNLYADEKNEDDRVLIFVDRQESADGLLRDLMKKGYPCVAIHGGKDQVDRDSFISDFKKGIVPILIATSVAARGLDVKQLTLVVNFDAPNHLEDYVHRAGRTGRAGNKGTAVTFLTEDQERYAVDISKALRQSGQPIPEPVKKLVEAFQDKVKAGKEKSAVYGFGGKGLERLDQERDATKARERKAFKTGDEPEEEEKEDSKDVKVGEDIFSKAASSVKAFDATPSTPTPIPGVPKGIDLDGKIIVHKTERETDSGPRNTLDKVAAAVAGINQKLSKAGVMRQGVPIDNKGPDAGAYHATLEINDFPRKFRLPFPHFLYKKLIQSIQNVHAGPSPTARTSPRSSSRRGHPSRRKAPSTPRAKSRSQARSRNCTSWWRGIRSWWSHRRCES